MMGYQQSCKKTEMTKRVIDGGSFDPLTALESRRGLSKEVGLSPPKGFMTETRQKASKAMRKDPFEERRRNRND